MHTAAANLRRLLRQIGEMKQTQNHPPKGIYLAPMVRGSELAFRMLVRRRGGASLCYSPMLRDRDVVAAASSYSPNHFSNVELAVDGAGRTDPVEETAYLMLRDVDPKDTANLVVQLCGSCPEKLARATTAALDVYSRVGALPAGIDMNLGCPQECALREGFGAFLAEKDPGTAVSCISSMRKAIDAHPCCKSNDGSRPRLSAKIRLLDGGVDDTIAFVRNLQSAGVDYVAIHCRQRADKHNGNPDWEAGGKIVAALSPGMPIILNGGIVDGQHAALVTEQTGCHAVMAATGCLQNHRLFGPCAELTSLEPQHLALEYLEFAEKYPPPSHLYVQKHLRWIFRATLRPENDPGFDGSNFSDWRVRLWSFLVRPYLRSVEQFRLAVALYVRLGCGEDDRRAPESIRHLVPDVSFGSVKRAGKTRTRGDRVWRCDK